MPMRLDQFLVQQGLVRSRSQAKEIIANGSVEIKDHHGDWRLIEKPNFTCGDHTEVRMLNDGDTKWVARSGLKLHNALSRLKVDVSNFCCLDLGQSTGGFTQSLLKRGAKKVVGVDIGRAQLVEDLKKDKRVVFFEGTDAREISFLKKDYKFEFIAADLSFISIVKVLPAILDVASSGSLVLILLKPQFEVGKEAIGRTGLVLSPELQLSCQKRLFDALNIGSVEVLDYFPSSIKGKNGNQEFICCFNIV